VLLVTSRAAFFLEESSGIAQVVDAFFLYVRKAFVA